MVGKLLINIYNSNLFSLNVRHFMDTYFMNNGNLIMLFIYLLHKMTFFETTTIKPLYFFSHKRTQIIIVSQLPQHNLIIMSNSLSLYPKFTNREDTFCSLVWWPKAYIMFPVTAAGLINDIASINFVLPNAFTGKLNGLEVPLKHAVMGNSTISRSEAAK